MACYNGERQFVPQLPEIGTVPDLRLFAENGLGVAAFEDGVMVGYVMVIYDYDVPEYDIWHMMIDEAQQNRGYGSAALDRVLDYIRTKPFGSSDRVTLTCSRDNASALKLYKSRGFAETGAEDEDEIELSLTLKG